MDAIKWFDKYLQPPSNEDILEIWKSLPPAYQDIMILKQIMMEF